MQSRFVVLAGEPHRLMARTFAIPGIIGISVTGRFLTAGGGMRRPFVSLASNDAAPFRTSIADGMWKSSALTGVPKISGWRR